MKRFLVLSLGAAVTLASLSMPAGAQGRKGTGTLAGRAGNEAEQPYSNYTVRARSASGGAANTVPLGPDARFAIVGLTFPSEYLIELLSKDGDVVCTEGPYKRAKTNITIDCGKVPAALWIAALAGGTTATAGVLAQSNSGSQ